MSENLQEENVVSDIYDNYHETQKEIYDMETRKTRNKLFTLAVLIFAMDFIALNIINAVNFQTLIIIAIVPVLFIGLAFLALKEPLMSMIIATVVIVGFWAYAAIQSEGRSAISGWLIKAVVVYLIIAGFQNAREAQRIKKELKI
jgi:hypothetical protein